VFAHESHPPLLLAYVVSNSWSLIFSVPIVAMVGSASQPIRRIIHTAAKAIPITRIMDFFLVE
jgi:hypothetical protein